MKCLIVIAHPLTDSLCGALARTTVAALTEAGHDVVVEDLYASGFSPVLTTAERQSYYSESFDSGAVAPEIERLLEAEAIVLVFPTWWFGVPRFSRAGLIGSGRLGSRTTMQAIWGRSSLGYEGCNECWS